MKKTNGVMMQYFEWYLPENCKLWKQLSKNAAELNKKGFTALWLPPAYKGQAGKSDVGYGVYDLYDLGEFDQKGSVETKYGSRDEYLKAIDDLHANGLQVYADIVLDHKIGADEQEIVEAVQDAEDDRNREVSEEHKIKAWTKFTFPGRKGKYSDFIWDHTCFSGVDFDARTKEKGIYNFKDADWSENTDKENGNSDYLMGANVDFSNPRVRRHLIDWGHWYLDTTHVDGFRLDAVKHIDSGFYPDWLYLMRVHYGAEFFSVGEYWNGDLSVLQNFISATGRCMSLFDVPLHFNLHHASQSNGEYDMSKLLDNTLVAADPALAVTFVDNHDTQPGQALESTVQEWFLPAAYAVILLRPQGYPCVFYGDYYGLDAREGRNIQPVIDIMLKLRHNNLYGIQRDYFDDSSVVGWTMEGDDEHKNSGLAVIMTDKTGGTKTMNVGAVHKGEVWKDTLGNCKAEVTIDEDGNGEFVCEDGSCSVYIKKK